MSDKFKNKKPESRKIPNTWIFTNTNYLIFLIGLLMILAGYIIMANGEVYSNQSLIISPLMLFVGYIILIPFALLYKKKEKDLGS
tara:strand:+ start:1338 stop:1592 length:255 start_codon:yes stop_codon:yes gene_type:complete